MQPPVQTEPRPSEAVKELPPTGIGWRERLPNLCKQTTCPVAGTQPFREAGKRRRLRPVAWSIVILAGVLFRAHIIHQLPPEVEYCAADFSAFYSGGSLVGSPQLYSPQAAFAAQERAIGCHHENLVFIKPPFYALLMWPFAQLPFLLAFYLFRVLVLAGVGLFLWSWPGNRWAAAAACAWSLPLAATFTVGQDVIFVLAAGMGADRVLRRE